MWIRVSLSAVQNCRVALPFVDEEGCMASTSRFMCACMHESTACVKLHWISLCLIGVISDCAGNDCVPHRTGQQPFSFI